MGAWVRYNLMTERIMPQRDKTRKQKNKARKQKKKLNATTKALGGLAAREGCFGKVQPRGRWLFELPQNGRCGLFELPRNGRWVCYQLMAERIMAQREKTARKRKKSLRNLHQSTDGGIKRRGHGTKRTQPSNHNPNNNIWQIRHLLMTRRIK